MMLPQNVRSEKLQRSFNCSISYFLQKKLVCVAKRIAARAEMQAKALIPRSGLVDMLVARLKADRALWLSSIPSSVNPAVLLSTEQKWFIKFLNTHSEAWKLFFTWIALSYFHVFPQFCNFLPLRCYNDHKANNLGTKVGNWVFTIFSKMWPIRDSHSACKPYPTFDWSRCLKVSTSSLAVSMSCASCLSCGDLIKKFIELVHFIRKLLNTFVCRM